MELQIVHLMNQFGRGELDWLTIFISQIPFLIVLWAVIAFLALFLDRRGKWIFLAIVAALALHFLISEGLLKHFLLNFFPLRARPWVAHPELIQPLGQRFTDSSFPSSHMASTLGVLTVLVFYYRKIWLPALIFVLLMAFARLHNGMHYPSDVLAGAFLGLIYGFLAITLVRYLERAAAKNSSDQNKTLSRANPL
jgi:undecaprenyl-diphosphatase